MKYLTLEEALAELVNNSDSYKTPDSLIELTRRLDATNSYGKVTVLYSGAAINGVSAADVVKSLTISGQDIRIVDNTDAARFLASATFVDAWGKTFGVAAADYQTPTTDSRAKIDAMFGALFHATEGPWAQVSERFINATEGEVRTITGGAFPDRVFGKTEIPCALNNEKITSIDGIPRADLQARGFDDAFKAISAQSDIYTAEIKFAVDSQGELIKVPLVEADSKRISEIPRVDATDFFATTGIPGNDPPVVFEHYRNGANYPLDHPPPKLESHREGAEILHEIKEHYVEQSKLMGPEHAALRAAALRTLDKLGWAGDLIALGLVANEANAAIEQGDNERAASLLSRWLGEFAGGLAAGAAAAQMVGSALAPLYLMGPAGAIAAGSLTLLAGVAGGVLGGAAAGEAVEAMLAAVKQYFGDATDAMSPLILDLDGDGVTTLALNASSIHFDLDHNGFAERTGWVAPTDGLLVLDRSHNGQIDSGAELFGNHTQLADGRKALNGFEALAEFDANRDGRITAEDAVFAQLGIWKDANSNAVVEDGELLSLSDAKVASIGLSFYANTWDVDASGNSHRQRGFYRATDGRSMSVDDVWFNTDPSRSLVLAHYETNAEIDALPDLPAIGNVLSLHQAMAADATGHLQALLQRWQTSPSDRDGLIHSIVQAWAGAEQAAPGTRGPFVDARHLATVEAISGRHFGDRDDVRGPSDRVPGPDAGASLEMAYTSIVDFVRQRLFTQLELPGMLEDLTIALNPDLSAQWDVRALKARWHAEWEAAGVEEHPAVRARMRTFFSVLEQYGPGAEPLIRALESAAPLASSDFEDAFTHHGRLVYRGEAHADRLDFALLEEAVAVDGGAGDDVIAGTRFNDLLVGGEGNDVLSSHAGNNVFVGGRGNDQIISRGLNDVYVFNAGDGRDVISGGGLIPFNAGTDTLRLGEGLEMERLVVTRQHSSIQLDWGTDDSVTITELSNVPDLIDRIEFADGGVLTVDELLQRAQWHDGPDNNSLYGWMDRGNQMFGHDGDDRLTGGRFEDLLVGGAGQDQLSGGFGSDVYRFARGDGADTIYEAALGAGDCDVLEFGDGITRGDLRLERTGTDLTLTFSDAQDRVTLVGWFEQQPRRIEKFRFTDGETVDVDAQEMEDLLDLQALQVSEQMSVSMASSLQAGIWAGAAVLPV